MNVGELLYRAHWLAFYQGNRPVFHAKQLGQAKDIDRQASGDVAFEFLNITSSWVHVYRKYGGVVHFSQCQTLLASRFTSLAFQAIRLYLGWLRLD